MIGQAELLDFGYLLVCEERQANQAERQRMTPKPHVWEIEPGTHDESAPAMTFAEIGKELGVSAQRVQQIYNRALQKLRKHPQAVTSLLKTAEEYRMARDRREDRKSWRQ